MNRSLSFKNRMAKSKRINHMSKNNDCVKPICSCGVPHRAYINFNIK